MKRRGWDSEQEDPDEEWFSEDDDEEEDEDEEDWEDDDWEEDEDKEDWEEKDTVDVDWGTSRDDELEDDTLPKLLGINPTLVKRLNQAGYHSIWDIADAEIDELMETTGLSSTIAKRIITKANQHLDFED